LRRLKLLMPLAVLLNPGLIPAGLAQGQLTIDASKQPSGLSLIHIYTFALQFPTKFSWELPRPKQTDADREAEFVKVCHENLLSLCDANRQMFKDGVALEHFAGASGVERAAFQAEAQAARQKFLINQASPTQLKHCLLYTSRCV